MTENKFPVQPGSLPDSQPESCPGGSRRLPPAPAPNWALFLDIDGTLLDIAARPDEVAVPPVLRRHLAAVQQALDGALALISGRPIIEIDRLFDPLRLAASGQHGSEWRRGPQQMTEVVARHPVPEPLRRLAEDLKQLDPAIVVEQKTHALAVHYRHAPALGAVLGERLKAALADHRHLVLLHGRQVWEVKDASQSKGTAVRHFMAEPRFAGRLPVFIGDDTTDIDGFRAVEAMGGMALPVGPAVHGAVHPERPGFADAAAVRRWLGDYARLVDGAAA
ncbi:MAG TPA: trehalose-phosphatase [Ferrovibrio sp.]|uniref:trehalose-phosphatase n=1 Tax=Ferrovibrio sp. TaxID=1917215 RepID=UPI002ED69728